MNEDKYLDYFALWLLIFGLWPLADPGHGADNMLSIVDLMLHIVAAVFLGSRWKIRVLRRTPDREKV